MNEQPREEESSGSMQRVWILLLLAGVALLAVAVALILTRQEDEEPELGADLAIGWAVADGETLVGTLTLTVDPANSGENEMRLDIEPLPNTWLQDVASVELHLLPLRGAAEELDVSFDLSDADQTGSHDVDLGGSDQWQATIVSGDRTLATIFLLLPDPNLFGNDAVTLMGEDPAARDLYLRASDNVAKWHRVRYSQQLSNGSGQAVVSFRDVNDGTDGSEAGFRYFTPGGLEAYVLGTTAWSRYPGEDWEVRETNAMIPPSDWGGEYVGATGFQLGPVSESPQGPCRMITFVVPESERQATAWYAWCIDEESGQVRRDSMISRAHYMITEFTDIDAEFIVQPPADAPPAPTASPVALVLFRQERRLGALT